MSIHNGEVDGVRDFVRLGEGVRDFVRLGKDETEGMGVREGDGDFVCVGEDTGV
jgi:hypothetical protein